MMRNPVNYHPTLHSTQHTERFSISQLIVVVFVARNFNVLTHSNHFHISYSRQLFLVKKALINLLYTTCTAPNSEQT